MLDFSGLGFENLGSDPSLQDITHTYFTFLFLDRHTVDTCLWLKQDEGMYIENLDC